jgi:N-methylhydantoinase B/oxoprolinase/acetone carboxylase alpha subunit
MEPILSTRQPNDLCAPWCKCVTCREVDWDAFHTALQDIERLEDYISDLEAKIETVKPILRHSVEISREYQDKYAGESMDDRERFVNGIKDEGTTNVQEVLKDITNVVDKED